MAFSLCQIGGWHTHANLLAGLWFERYTGGDNCPASGSGPASSIIKFTCSGTSEIGTPQLASKPSPGGNCVYHFEWHTCLVCPASASQPDPCHGSATPRPTGSTVAPNHTPSTDPAKANTGTGSGTVAAIVIVIILVVSVVFYFLRSQDNRDALRATLGLSGASGAPGYVSHPTRPWLHVYGYTCVATACA